MSRGGPDSGGSGDVWTNDRGAIYRALERGQQLGWQRNALDWQLVNSTAFVVGPAGTGQTLGEFRGDAIDDIPWLVSLHRWQGDVSIPPATAPAMPRPPISLWARVFYGAGNLGPEDVAVDWPAAGTQFVVHGSSIRIDAFGMADATGGAVITDLPQNFGLHITPARSSHSDPLTGPTYTETFNLGIGATTDIRIPRKAVAFNVMDNTASTGIIVSARDNSVAPRVASWPAGALNPTVIGNAGRLPWWTQYLRVTNSTGNAVTVTLIFFLAL